MRGCPAVLFCMALSCAMRGQGAPELCQSAETDNLQ